MKKKIAFIITSSLTLTLLAACGSKNTSLPVQPTLQNNQSNQPVSTLSRRGLSSFYKFMLDNTFKTLDKDQDRVVTYEEFNPYNGIPSTPPGYGDYPGGDPGYPGNDPGYPDDPNYSDPGYPDYGTENLPTSGYTPGYPYGSDGNYAQRFAKVDRNRDGRITLQEAEKRAAEFLGQSKKEMQNAAKSAFAFVDRDVNKKISQDEFMRSYSGGYGYSYMEKTMALQSFLAADKNKNGNLSFSEYEDLVYSSTQSYMSVPPEPIPAPPAPPMPTSSPAYPYGR